MWKAIFAPRYLGAAAEVVNRISHYFVVFLYFFWMIILYLFAYINIVFSFIKFHFIRRFLLWCAKFSVNKRT